MIFIGPFKKAIHFATFSLASIEDHSVQGTSISWYWDLKSLNKYTMEKISFVIINYLIVSLLAENKSFLLRQIKTCLLEDEIQNFNFVFSKNVPDEILAELTFIYDVEMPTTNSYQEW